MSTRHDADTDQRKPNWIRRHPLLSTLIALLLIAAFFSDGDDESTSADDDSAAEVIGETTTPAESETPTEREPSAEPTRTKPTRTAPTPTKPTRTEPTRIAPTPTKPTRIAPTPTEPDPPVARYYAVTEVVDGDTVKVARNGETSIRIIGIDTPETVHPTEPIECGGPRASALASQLLTGKRVRLVFDPSQGRIDAYGRTLAYLQVPGLGDFGLTMIQRGAAAEYTYDTAYARQGRYQAAERHARTAQRGLWGICGGPHVAPPTTAPPPPPPTTAAPPPPVTTAPPPPKPPVGGGTDPRFTYCYEANDAGYGPYYEGQDPEYQWYDDADSDGIVCES